VVWGEERFDWDVEMGPTVQQKSRRQPQADESDEQI